ncbi:phage tail component protein [Teladorsagia circumcincta]|uniref:Phage tail component protein n=1 Tax=Teladorsagia circumcincta TaxID=45464 RepID=A0A2G9U571_TELCI|nr:phage tail component protein [Teladorsagia circumcincta]
MIRMRTLVVPNDLQSPLERQIVIRNITKRDWVVKIKSDAPRAMQFDADKIVIDARKYVVIKMKFNLNELSSYKSGISSKIFLFARPLTPYNENCLRLWLTRENNELTCQLSHVIQLMVTDKVFSAEKLVLDLPGYATAIDPVPFAIEEDLDSRCETAYNIEDDTNTARRIDDQLLEHARLIVRRKSKMTPEEQEKLMVKVKNWLEWDKIVHDGGVPIPAWARESIRARMEGGFARLNDLTIINVTRGFAKYMLEFHKGKTLTGVAIGYDARHHSRRFAELAANVFVRHGIPVYFFSEVCPTPVVSWATIKLNCDAGLVITASHNPKYDNGYKAYWTNGAQILFPSNFVSIILAFVREINAATKLKFTYSAFHGVGYRYAMRMFKEFGFAEDRIVSVKEQQEADPDFPTVPFPNPEEGAKVLLLSFATAEAYGSTVIVANDPDADRIQIAEKKSNGDWKVFTGNEMGALMTWWVWMNWSEAHPDVDKSDVYILNSAVSSQIVKTIADQEGFKSDVTLTGFKWMGNKADELRKQGKHDGISTAAMFAEMAAWLETQKKTLQDQLFEIYNKYGFHLVRSSYWFTPSPAVTKELFASLRKDLKFPDKIGPHKVKTVRDLTIGYDNSQPDNKPVSCEDSRC